MKTQLMKTTKPKIGCYVRVSTDAQSTASQRPAIKQWADSAHIPHQELSWYEDKLSGKTMDRPALTRLLKHVADGKIDTVVVYDLSRFARNLSDGIKTLADLAQKVRVVSVSENIDFSNSTGMLIASILLSVAQWSREQTVEKIRAGLAARREQGLPMGRPRNQSRLAEVKQLVQELGATEAATRLGCSRSNIYSLLSRAG